MQPTCAALQGLGEEIKHKDNTPQSRATLGLFPPALSTTLALSHRTNQELRVHTFLSAVLLPMSVVTGSFGTNFALAEYQYAEPFYVMLAGMGVLAASILAFMRWQRWL